MVNASRGGRSLRRSPVGGGDGTMPSRPLKPPKASVALKALDRGLYEIVAAIRWRIVAENTPPGSRIRLRASDESNKASQRAFDGFEIVRRALGYDPDDDEPPPKRHWDAGA